MRVIVFDLLPYRENLDHLKVGNDLPWPLGRRHFKPAEAVKTYEEHLTAWEELDRLGYDGVGFNEHHTSPYGLMTSPNLMAASAAQRTKRLTLLVYGNLLPLHHPLRLAEELAMLDCLSNGRLIAGIARGIPREYVAYNVPMAQSRPRFEEAYDILIKAWTEEAFSHHGQFWTFKDVAIWPRPVQQPHPPIWTPVSISKESIEWAVRHDVPITPGIERFGLRDDIIRYYAKCLAAHGRRITPGHIVIGSNAYIADSKARAVKEYAPYFLYFSKTLFPHGNITDRDELRAQNYLGAGATDYLRPESIANAAKSRELMKNLGPSQVAAIGETMPWGTADEVRERIIAAADSAGSNTVHVHMNQGALPHEMFLEQIRRFAKDVLPALQAHEVTRVPLADEVTV
jgi:alkanesulfonate monooxygenase SsuD/methylene tetrahydromethanopterin reductase-like flavin-dependent oxidoreductase (luciferase family)